MAGGLFEVWEKSKPNKKGKQCSRTNEKSAAVESEGYVQSEDGVSYIGSVEVVTEREGLRNHHWRDPSLR